MYTLLIADDERAIREGIANSVQWDEIGVSQVLLAKNGQEAYDMILEKGPDIVLTDIIMPEITGIELIENVKRVRPHTQFIILSGYDHFEFAHKAMQNSVKWYLLKPCNADEIRTTVLDIIHHLKETEEREQQVQSMKENLKKLLPQAKEQFFRDFIVGRGFEEEAFLVYKGLFEIKDSLYRMVLFKAGRERDYFELITLRRIIEENIEPGNICLCLIVNAKVVLLTDILEFSLLADKVKEIRRQCKSNYSIDITAAISQEDFIKNAPNMYRELKDIIKFEFYLGEGRIITREDVNLPNTPYDNNFDRETAEMAIAIKSGNVNEVCRIINHIFADFIEQGCDISIAKALSIELYMVVIRQCEPDEAREYIKNIVLFNEFETIGQISDFIQAAARRVAEKSYEVVQKNHGKIVNQVLDYVSANISNEELSLSLIASQILYVNVDYLGKLFKKKTGIKFSQYLMNTRIDKAKELIEASPGDMKMYEIAQNTGFGSNPAYFSQVFKKNTGYTPKEYQDMLMVPAEGQ